MELDTLVKNVETIALDALDNLDSFRPGPYAAPPGRLGRAIAEARHQRHLGRMERARDVYRDAIADQALVLELALYREYLTRMEADNARRLATGCWVMATLLARAEEGDEPLTLKLAALRSMLVTEYAVTELRTERGWADAVCRQYGLLPIIWRHV